MSPSAVSVDRLEDEADVEDGGDVLSTTPGVPSTSGLASREPVTSLRAGVCFS